MKRKSRQKAKTNADKDFSNFKIILFSDMIVGTI